MTFEYVADATVQRNFDTLARLLIDTGDKTLRLRFGTDSVTYPGGSSDSGDTTVSHGLGVDSHGTGITPVVVFTQSTSITAMARPSAVGDTTFTVKHRTLDGSTPAAAATQAFYWLAIG